jgi:hypothetical protein
MVTGNRVDRESRTARALHVSIASLPEAVTMISDGSIRRLPAIAPR